VRIDRIEFQNYRNRERFSLEPCAGVNVICGENAVGKTNLLESMWLCTGEKSFRGSTDAEMVRFGSADASIRCAFFSGGRSQQCELLIREGKREAVLNKVPLKSPSELNGKVLGVIFSPQHMALVQNGPEERRRFVDSAIRQIKPGYARTLQNYKRALAQRNSLLKDIPFHTELRDTLEVWDEHIATLGGHLAAGRVRYIRRLSPLVGESYDGISSGKEQLTCAYSSNTFAPDCEDPGEQTRLFREKLEEGRKQDLEAGHTGQGPHRDDLELQINGISARTFGSQGQKRSVILALKLGEASLLRKTVGETPVMFLDDVMSELDEHRQRYLLHHLDDWQVFITACAPLEGLEESPERLRIFRLEAGEAEAEG